MKIEKISFGAIATKLSRAEMKKIMAGSGSGGGAVMHCRDAGGELIGETIDVTSCDVSSWDTNCAGKSGYVKEKSNCNSW